MKSRDGQKNENKQACYRCKHLPERSPYITAGAVAHLTSGLKQRDLLIFPEEKPTHLTPSTVLCARACKRHAAFPLPYFRPKTASCSGENAVLSEAATFFKLTTCQSWFLQQFHLRPTSSSLRWLLPVLPSTGMRQTFVSLATGSEWTPKRRPVRWKRSTFLQTAHLLSCRD